MPNSKLKEVDKKQMTPKIIILMKKLKETPQKHEKN